jgi:hypothetical protein
LKSRHLSIQGLARQILEFFMVVIIAVNADRESVGMVSEEGDSLRFAPIIIPWNEGNSCVKVMLFHLREQTLVAKVSVRLAEPGIVNRKIRVMMEGVPTSFASCILDKHHHRSNFRKSGFDRIGCRCDGVTTCEMRPGEQKYFLAVEVRLDEYRDDLAIVSYAYDFLCRAASC